MFRNLVRDGGLWLRCFSGRRFRVALNGGSLTPGPLLFVDKTPDGPHQMRHGNVDTALPENLCDPMHAQPAAVRLQDLFLILPQCVDLGLLAITAAFRAAGDFEKILRSGFEIRISQCASPRVFGFMIKEGNSAIKFGITIEESFGVIQRLLLAGLETKIGILHPRGFGGQSCRPTRDIRPVENQSAVSRLV